MKKLMIGGILTTWGLLGATAFAEIVPVAKRTSGQAETVPVAKRISGLEAVANLANHGLLGGKRLLYKHPWSAEIDKGKIALVEFERTGSGSVVAVVTTATGNRCYLDMPNQESAVIAAVNLIQQPNTAAVVCHVSSVNPDKLKELNEITTQHYVVRLKP